MGSENPILYKKKIGLCGIHRGGSLTARWMNLLRPLTLRMPSGLAGVEKKMLLKSIPKCPDGSELVGWEMLLKYSVLNDISSGSWMYFLLKGLKRNPDLTPSRVRNSNQPWEDETQRTRCIGVPQSGIGALYILFSDRLKNSMLLLSMELFLRKTGKGIWEAGG